MISPCKDVALVALFPTKLVSCHSEFPSSSYEFYIASYLEKEKKISFGPGGTTADGTGPSTASAIFLTGSRPVPGRYRTGTTVTYTVPARYPAGSTGPAQLVFFFFLPPPSSSELGRR
jgi:hypothetical protein